MFDLNTGFARLINTHSVLFGNVARLNRQFDVLDLNTGLALVVKTLPDGTFSSIWVNRDGTRTLFRFVNTLVQFCGEHACSVSRRMSNILTYVRVALATSDVQSIRNTGN